MTLRDLVTWATWGLATFVVLVAAVELIEIGQLVVRRRRVSGAAAGRATPRDRFVSIHVPIHDEPPDLVIATLRSLLALDWLSYEVVVIDNNTVSPDVWQPVARFAARHAHVIHFHHLEGVTGFKAGALNQALARTDPRAECVVVVDCDYQVEEHFLQAVIGHFEDDAVAFVQAPQDYRTVGLSSWQRWACAEYARFFEVGMTLRPAHNALHLHGTMVAIRTSALIRAGGWDEHCVTEDCELGLRLLANGGVGVYRHEPLGHGLLPLRFDDYCAQRRRWVTGGVQAIRQHGRLLASGADGDITLTLNQRLCYLQGWLPWFRDFLISIALVVLSGGLLLSWVAPPAGAWAATLATAVMTASALVVAKEILVLKWHMRLHWADTIGALLLVVGLIPTIGTAWARSVVNRRAVFERTPKSRLQLPRVRRRYCGDAVVAVGLTVLAGGSLVGEHDPAMQTAAILIMGALVATARMALMARSRLSAN